MSYPSHATGLRKLNDQSGRGDGKSHSTFSVLQLTVQAVILGSMPDSYKRKKKKIPHRVPKTLCPLNNTAARLTTPHPEGTNYQEIENNVSYAAEAK